VSPLAGQVGLVTGASRGIGLAVADALGAAGAHVVRLARSLADATSERGTDLRCDLTKPDEVERAARRVLDGPGVPDIVVNNAGVFHLRPLAELSLAQFTETVAVNLTAPFLLARALLPHLVRRGRGHFVTIGSIADHLAQPGGAAYTASKYGVRGMHEVIAAELAGTGVRATLVSPGQVDTAMWDAVDPDATPGFVKRRDMLRPADVAETVLFAVTRRTGADVTEIRLMPAPPRRPDAH
jgi:NAD(P)-dependent dehydrogenase (short-subunit alcohol dehydrogenase family)